jgi:hypothetical protein
MPQSQASHLAIAADSPEDIAEMMAEVARVDALFQSGAISTCLPLFFSDRLESARAAGHSEGAGGAEERPAILPAA